MPDEPGLLLMNRRLGPERDGAVDGENLQYPPLLTQLLTIKHWTGSFGENQAELLTRPPFTPNSFGSAV